MYEQVTPRRMMSRAAHTSMPISRRRDIVIGRPIGQAAIRRQGPRMATIAMPDDTARLRACAFPATAIFTPPRFIRAYRGPRQRRHYIPLSRYAPPISAQLRATILPTYDIDDTTGNAGFDAGQVKNAMIIIQSSPQRSWRRALAAHFSILAISERALRRHRKLHGQES